MRLVLHFGVHRTGTTSLQNQLAKGRQILLRQGVYYPDISPLFGGDARAQFSFAHALAEQPDHPGIPAFIRHIEEAGRRGARVLISAEPMYRHIAGGGGIDTWREDTYWALRKRYLDTIRRALRAFDILPVIVFRRQDSLVESWYAQQMTNGRIPPADSFRGFVAQRRNMLLYARQLDLLTSVFGRAKALIYEQSADSAEAIKQLLGVKLPAVKERHYVSLDARLIVWAADMLKQFGTDEFVLRKKVISGEAAAEAVKRSPSGAGSLWEPEERHALLASLADDNLVLGQRLGLAEPFPPIANAKPLAAVSPELNDELQRVLAHARDVASLKEIAS